MRSRNKTFYRSFRYKEDLFSSPKLLRYGLAGKKKKWTFLNNQRKRLIYQLSTPLPESPLQRISRSFALKWKRKQSFKSHFRVQRENQIKSLRKKAEKAAGKTPFHLHLDHPMGKKNLLFLQLWESRLDLLLWRAALAPTLPAARQLIRRKLVFVNQTPVSKPSKLLQEGDFVQLTLKGKERERFLQDLRERHFFQTSGNKTDFPRSEFPVKVPPFYLEIHYTSLAFVFSAPRPETLLYSYPIGALRT